MPALARSILAATLAIVVGCDDSELSEDAATRIRNREYQTGQLYAFRRESQERLSDYEAKIAELSARVRELEALEPLRALASYVRVEDDWVIIEGANLNVRNAEGSTDSTDGTGNIAIGWLEPREFPSRSDREGSHNLVLGMGNRWESYGGIVAGTHNSIEAPGAVVLAGYANRAAGAQSVVVAGERNQCIADGAVVATGQNNTATGEAAFIGSGVDNDVDGLLSSLLGGQGAAVESNMPPVLGDVSGLE